MFTLDISLFCLLFLSSDRDLVHLFSLPHIILSLYLGIYLDIDFHHRIYKADNIQQGSLTIMGFFRIFKLLRCLLGGSACCQQSAEVWGSRRLLSFPSTLALLLGNASTLLQRHQLLHWRDGGPHRLHRPAQEGLFFFVLRFALFYFLCSCYTSTETQEEWHYYNRFCLLVHRFAE